MRVLLMLFIFILPAMTIAGPNKDILDLSADFWQWRYTTQPATSDDILRVERPDGWQPDYSASALREYREKYVDFRKRLDAIPKATWTRSDSVDYLCLRSAIERVNWELNVLRIPHRNPDFYVHQTLGALYELLVIHSPMTDNRMRNIIGILRSFPKTVADARGNLTEASAPFAKIALEHLSDVRSNLMAVQEALCDYPDDALKAELANSMASAAAALEQYREWIEDQLPNMTQPFSCGRDAYVYYLKNVALIPGTPEELLAQGRIEWRRSVAFETFEKMRNAGAPEPELFGSVEEQVAQARKDEQAIREFLEEKDIMSVPDWLPHYLSVERPAKVEPLTFMGVDIDFTSESRLDENASRYIPDPSPSLSYFYRTMAYDPRPIIVHEGVPGHYFQLARSWKHPNPIRRRFVDPGSNEGIGLYVEELMLQFGLFDNKPRTREIMYNFMRLRALRVEIDIQLALGNFGIAEAGAYLAKSVPMDEETAVAESGFFAYNPGQAISYQIGKIQVMKFLSDAKIQLGDAFNLRAFHDYLIDNGNVPIALLRWEYLGLNDEVEQFFNEVK